MHAYSYLHSTKHTVLYFLSQAATQLTDPNGEVRIQFKATDMEKAIKYGLSQTSIASTPDLLTGQVGSLGMHHEFLIQDLTFMWEMWTGM